MDDPRVFFAAIRTLLAWTRTSVSLMGMGFIIERFGLYLSVANSDRLAPFERDLSFFLGVAFILLGALVSLYSMWHYRQMLKFMADQSGLHVYRPYTVLFVDVILCIFGITISIYMSVDFLQPG